MSLNIDQNQTNRPVEPTFVITAALKRDLINYLERNTSDNAIQLWSELHGSLLFPQQTIDKIVKERSDSVARISKLNDEVMSLRAKVADLTDELNTASRPVENGDALDYAP